MRVAQVVLGEQASMNRSEQLGHVGKELVGTDVTLEKTPEAFNEIEGRAVAWQPKDPDTMLKVA